MRKTTDLKSVRRRWLKFGLLNPLPMVRIDGRKVGLCFTYDGLDQLGHGGVAELVEKATSGLPGDGTALAKLIELGTGGQVLAEDLITGRRRVYFEEAILGVARAWHAAMYGAPPALAQRWWERAFRRPLQPDWRAAGGEA